MPTGFEPRFARFPSPGERAASVWISILLGPIAVIIVAAWHNRKIGHVDAMAFSGTGEVSGWIHVLLHAIVYLLLKKFASACCPPWEKPENFWRHVMQFVYDVHFALLLYIASLIPTLPIYFGLHVAAENGFVSGTVFSHAAALLMWARISFTAYASFLMNWDATLCD